MRTFTLALCAIFVQVCTSRSIAKDGIESLNREPRSLFQSSPTDPEVDSNPTEIIQRWGYPVEEYSVTTEDGYILSLLRIPHGRESNSQSTPTEPRPVIYFQHGIESSCIDWIANLPHQAAAFIYADLGFDVWMGNFRGNKYSMGHVKYQSTEHEYWSFSWDEMARYDLPAMINKSLEISGAQSVYYVGHSMGTSTIFAQLSQDQDFAKTIKKVYALAPVSTVTHVKGPAKYLSIFYPFINRIVTDVGIDSIFPMSKVQEFLAEHLCGWFFTQKLCTSFIMLVAGPESNQLNNTRLPVYLAHTPAGTSKRTVGHFAQLYNAKKFQMYDYGTQQENQLHYHQKSPPEFDVTRIQTPIHLYWGGNDYLADPEDVKELKAKLQNLGGSVSLPDFNHIDFIWGLRAAKEVYAPIYKDIVDDFAKAL